ncbi:MAG: SH3 domain-containing protein [Methyloceanibacter sp.]|jgi:SH3-like domain-containing protein
MSGDRRVGHRLSIGIALALICLAGVNAVAAGDASQTEPPNGQSGLPVPRFVSLKSDRVNVRKGPNTDQAIVWVFNRAGLPVEVIAESENWRRVRDSEGADGWVFHSLLSGRRTVLVAPWSKDHASVPLYASESTNGKVVAQLEAGVLGNVLSCDGEWCELSIDDYSGYVQQDQLWGVYRGEAIK